MKRLGLIFCFIQILSGAQSTLADPVTANPILSQKAEEIVKRSMSVIQEDEGVVSLSLLKNGQALANKTQILFIRRKGSRMEVIANGVVTGEQKNAKGMASILVALNRDAIIKYPVKGDYAIPMDDPNGTGVNDGKDQNDFLVPEIAKEKNDHDRPGYMEYAKGLMMGTLNTNSSSNADAFKKAVNYRFKMDHFAYFSDFYPIGIEYDSHSGNFPTATYYSKIVSSSEIVSMMSFQYRFKTLMNRKLAPIIKVNSLSDQFKTDNTDENLLTTKITGYGIGARVNYDFVSPIWKPEKANFGFKLQQLFIDFNYFPSITAKDNGISRGTSSNGSNATTLKTGFTTLFYVGFIPIIKRFIIQGSYGIRSYNLKFQGSTVSEVGNLYQIPSGTTSVTSESDFRGFIGVRIEDPIRLLFKDIN